MNMWLALLINAALIVLAGSQLARNAERISRDLGLSSAWAGALLLPLATSLPELVTCSRAAMIDAPDLAGGNIYGSILFNLVLIALIDLAQGRGPLTAKRKKILILTGILSIFAIAFSILGILLSLPLGLGWVGYDTLALVLLYLVGSALIMGMDKHVSVQVLPGGHDRVIPASEHRRELYQALLIFSAAGAVIIFAGINLTDAADRIALETGMNRTLIGSLFIAVSTSLPELVTTLSAVRLGHVEMAIGNVFGANFFNILLLFFTDLFYREGLLLSSLAGSNVVVAVVAIFLTLVAVISLVYPFRRQWLHMGLPSLIILGGYLTAFAFLFFAN